MTRAVIYGATDTGKRIYEEIKESCEVIMFLDDDARKWGTEVVDGIKAFDPAMIRKEDFDEVFVGVLTFYQEVMERLRSFGIPSQKINGKYVELPGQARIEFLKSMSSIIYQDSIPGNVAELGVFRGEFAKEINRAFSDRLLYLFDTFEGFPKKDSELEVEKKLAKNNKAGYFSDTSVDYVLSLMSNAENCRVKKGYFPESAAGVDDTFCFVNLDADLYAPTLSGLEFFFPRLSKGGVILVHDYFSKAFFGAKEAVDEFCKREKLTFVPIGDTLSVAIRKA